MQFLNTVSSCYKEEVKARARHNGPITIYLRNNSLSFNYITMDYEVQYKGNREDMIVGTARHVLLQ